MRTTKPLILAVVLIAGSPGQSAGQNTGVDQFESSRQQRETQTSLLESFKDAPAPPPLYPDETIDVGPQSILKIKKRKTWFEAHLDSQLFYTDNMLLQEDNVDLTDTSVFVNTAQLSLSPTPLIAGRGTFAPRLGYRHQWFNYALQGNHSSDLSVFDFDVQTAFTDARYRVGNWIFDAAFDFNRLLSHQPSYMDYDEFYREYVPRAGVKRLLPLQETKFFSIGYEAAYRFTETQRALQNDVNDRMEHVLLTSYTHAFSPRLAVQPYHRFQYSHYTSGLDRNDYLNSFGLYIYYFFTPNFSARLFATYDFKDSDHPLVQDYRKLDSGIGLNVNFRF